MMFTIFKKLNWFFKEHWKRYTIAIFFLIVVGVLDVIPPRMVGMAIDDIHFDQMTSGKLMHYIGYLSLILVTSYGLTYIWMYLLFSGANIIERKLRSQFMGHLFKMTPSFFERNRTGDLMARATNDLKAVSVTAGFGVLTLTDSSIFMLTILTTMGFFISWKLTFTAIIPLPFMAILMKIYGSRIHKRFTEAQDAFGDMNDRVLESVAGVRVIRAYVQERADEKRFSDMTNDVYEKNIKVAVIDSLFEPTIKILVGISFMIGLGYGAFLVFHQTISLGDLVSFNVYLGMLIWPMFAIGELINVMQRGNASLDRVQETLNSKEDVINPTKPIMIDQPESIKFSQFSFQYPTSNTENLRDIKVDLQKGQTLGVVGKTGSGKTTFVKQLLREYPMGKGELSFSEVSLADQLKEDVRDWIGYVPQDHVLFSRTVRENILFGHPEATEEELQQSIDQSAFRKDLEMLPEGLNTLVGEKGVALSGGQKQRISIARALIKNPEILILDDSLSAVDAKTEAKIIENIRSERSGKTTIITTHRLSAVAHADWVIVLEEGKVIQEGTHLELIDQDGWYKEQFDRQQIESSLEEVEV
jgi:ATP-binding cassette subfamily B multidrug efflux pump